MDFELKDWDLNYAKSLAFHSNNEKIANNLRNIFPYPYTLEDAINFIEFSINSIQENPNQILKAIIIEDKAVGSISIIQKEDVNIKTAELGYWLSESFWNNGIMSRAISIVSEMAFKNLDIVKIFAEPFENNLASRKVLEKLGYELEAILKNNIYKNGNICNSCIYSLFK